MNVKKQLLLSASLVILFSLLSTKSEAQVIYYVDSATGNDTHAGTSWATAFRNVTKAVAAAKVSASPEVDIWISKGTYTPIDGITSLPANHRDTSFTFYRGNGVGKALKIYGGFAGTETSIGMRDTVHRTYLDGKIGSSMKSFHVVVIAGLSSTADSLVLDGLTFSSGLANDSLVKTYNSVSVNRSYGGGLYISNNSSLKFSMRNCVIETDSAVGALNDWSLVDGAFIGGAAAYGGGIYNNHSSPTFYNCTFIANSVHGGSPDDGSGTYAIAGTGYGGAIYNVSSLSSFTNCNFISNIATGGGVPTLSGSGGKGGGGGVYSILSTCQFNNCNFASNKTVGGGALGFGAGGFGGAVLNANSSSRFRHCNFVSNVATSNGVEGGSSGGVHNMSGSNSTFDTCTFTTNSAFSFDKGFGGAMCNDSSSPVLNYCIFNSDSARGVWSYGGAIFNNYSSPVYSNCIFDGNISMPFYLLDTNRGGAVYNFHSSPVFNTCIFRNNLVDGGGQYGYGGAVYNAFSPAIFNYCDFLANIAISTFMGACGSGGAIFNQSSTSVISHCNFISNLARGGIDAQGGAIFNYASSPLINLCRFESNHAIADAGSLDGEGGAISSVFSPQLIRNCVFLKNTSSYYGGAIYQGSDKLSLENCSFISDSAKYGGVVRLDNYTYPVTLAFFGNVFVGNISTMEGGAINFNFGASGGQDTLINNLFALNKDIGIYGAGAILIVSDTCYIANNTFYADSGTGGGRGGAINFAGTGGRYTIVNNVFYKNYGVLASGDTATASGNVYFFDHNSFSTTNPLFVNESDLPGPDGVWGTADDGLHLTRCSSARNTGLNSYVIPGEVADITGAHRIQGISVDMGAYESNSLGLIAGVYDVCLGHTTMLGDTTVGGTWISKVPAVATVSSTGLVTAVSVGADTILYIFISSCGTDTTTAVIHVIPPTYAGIIHGASSICVGATTVLADSITGGVWSVTNSHASISSSGLVTGLTAGLDTVKYTNSCGLGSAQLVITVNALPHVGAITGATTVCTGLYILLSDTTVGGIWRTFSTNIVVTGDAVTGVTPGTASVHYVKTSTSGCIDSAVISITVIAAPPHSVLTGSAILCAGATTHWTASDTGGTWSISDPAITAVSTSGTVSGFASGTSELIYSKTNTCGTTVDSVSLVIERMASILSGTDTFCVGTSWLFTDSVAGGIWSSDFPTVTSVDAVGRVTGVGQGADVISYSVTNSCGTSDVFTPVYVQDTAKAITGKDTVCTGRIIILSDVTTAGTWSSSNSAIATIDFSGSVTGVAAGICTVTYLVSNTCGTTNATKQITVLDVTVCDSLNGINPLGQNSTVNIYPNPAYDEIIIENAKQNTTIKIYDNLGQLEYESLIRKKRQIIQLNNFPSGVYQLRLIDLDGNHFAKVIVKQ
jgi:predicted outer membrane repeat protein